MAGNRIPNQIGKVRQSSVLMNYGPGAIVDFRVEGSGAAVSVVAAGLEEWEDQLKEAGGSSSDMKRFTEKRLCEKLGVSHFRLPPIAPDKQNDDGVPVIPLIGARFPGWLQCPYCDTIMPARKWGSSAGDPSRFCDACSAKRPGNEKVYVVPVRFVTACRNGHLDDFPWSDWVHRGRSCLNRKKFKLESVGPGLAGLVLSCPSCKISRSMEHIFTREAHKGCQCSGRRPWLKEADEGCDLAPVTIQRGASNLYFPRFESALVIPPWSEEIIVRLGHRWNDIETIVSQEDRHKYIEMFWDDISEDIGEISRDEFKRMVDEKVDEATRSKSGNLRWDEYRQFMVASGHGGGRGDEFDVRVELAPKEVPHIGHLLRVVSLREIRVLKSFTRIESFPARPPVKIQPLSKSGLKWLPAIEVRGEGVFLALDMERVRAWETKTEVMKRASKLQNYGESNVLNPDGGAVTIDSSLGARYLLLHALAHVLMRQLSLQCGYSSASLRELIYVGSGDRDMSGLMIYTSTSDSDGTLGGLQRQGERNRFGQMFIEAIRSNEWCASDPLCINGLVSTTEASNLAACHSCLLAPETSCQDYNRFLDRAMLVGTPEDRSIGFFSDLFHQNRD
jgi:hypothetical protein